MYKVKKIILLAFTLVLALSATTFALPKEDLAKGFAGVSWGGSSSQLKNKVAFSDSSFKNLPPELKIYKTNNSVVIGGTKIDEVLFFFYSDQFTQAVLKHSDFSQLTEAMTKEYSAPHLTQAGTLTWVIPIDLDNEELVNVGILEAQGGGVIVNTKYLVKMLEGLQSTPK